MECVEGGGGNPLEATERWRRRGRAGVEGGSGEHSGRDGKQE